MEFSVSTMATTFFLSTSSSDFIFVFFVLRNCSIFFRNVSCVFVFSFVFSNMFSVFFIFRDSFLFLIRVDSDCFLAS